MTQRQLAVVGLKLLGVYAAILVILFSQEFTMLLSSSFTGVASRTFSKNIAVVGLAVGTTCFGVVALLLMIWGRVIAKWLLRARPEEGQPLESVQLTDRQLAVVCFKLLGIYTIILAIRAVEGLVGDLAWSLLPDAGNHLRFVEIMTKIISVARVAFLAVAGLVLLFRSEVVARWLLGETVKPALPPPPVLQQIQRIAFSMAGIFILLTAIPDLGYGVMNVSSIFKYGVLDGLSSFDFWRLFGALLRFAVGLCLLFGARGLARLLHKIRAVATSTGRPAPDQPTDGGAKSLDSRP